MNRFSRSNVERTLSNLLRRDQTGKGLKKEGDKLQIDHGDDLIETRPDGKVVVNLPRLRAALFTESFVVQITDDGEITLGPKSVEAPITWNTRTSAHGLAFRDNLELFEGALRAVRASDPGNAPTSSVAALAAHVDLLRDALVDAGLMV